MADLRHLATALLFASACSSVHADPMTPPRPRIELRTVKQGWGTIIGAYVRDNELGEPAPCDITDAYACGGIPGRCYKPEGSLQGCCVQ